MIMELVILSVVICLLKIFGLSSLIIFCVIGVIVLDVVR